jgi:hypothetical protein
MVGGFSQNFQWGAAWSGMRIAAERLEAERDRISVTPPGQIDAVRELALLNEKVLDETRAFFRLVGQIDNLRPIGNRPSSTSQL